MAIKNFICKGYYHKNKNYITLDFTNMLNNGKNCSWFPGTDVDDENSVTVLKIQEYESGSSIYLVLNKGNETESKEKIYKHFLEGKYLIGNFNWFSDPHLIFNIKSYNDINENNVVCCRILSIQSHVVSGCKLLVLFCLCFVYLHESFWFKKNT